MTNPKPKPTTRAKTSKRFVLVADHWLVDLGKVRCWLAGYRAGRGMPDSVGIPGEDTLRQIQQAIREPKKPEQS